MAVRLMRARRLSGVSARWATRYRRQVAVASCGVVVSLALSLVQGVPALAAPAKPNPAGPSMSSVPVGKQATQARVPSQTDGPGVTRLDRTTLPSASTVVAAMSGPAVDAGGMPVTVSPPSAGTDDPRVGKKQPAEAAGPSSVRVRVLDSATAKAAGVSGVVVALSRADKATASGRVRLRLDYSSFANAYGGDYGNRLQLVALPACALNTPDRPECQRQTDLGSVNQAGAVSAEVSVAGDDSVTSAAAPMVVALDAGASSLGETFAATSLSPSYSWAAGTPSGSFDFTYPLQVPASLGGPKPDLALQYDSGAVDAQTLTQNGQTSWAGEGWDLQTGYVERSYRSCKQDGGTTGDLCWFSSYNATLVFGGRSSVLVRDNTSGVWHAQDDSGLKVEQLFGSAAGAPGDNGTYNKEYWRVTTQDGTQYYFGENLRYAGAPWPANSALTEPVYGNNPGEPCYNATFANASCQQGYRWNLDYVADPRGNSMTYYYTKFSGYYGHNGGNGVAPYDLSSTLDHIDYDTPAGSEGSVNAPIQVYFTKTGRCQNTCQQNTSDYPDTPWDLYCSSTTSCPTVQSPVYFNPYKLSTVYTQLWNAATSGYRRVDQWDLSYTYPSTGDNIPPAGDDTSPNLWLHTVTHTGFDPNGASLAEPTVTFDGVAKFNRVNWSGNQGNAPYTHYRLSSITNGTGGQTLVGYSTTDCPTYPYSPTPDSNPYPCFPQYFTPDQNLPGWDWFNKYLVTTVTNHDLTGGSPDEVTSYTYSTANSSDPSLWHHDYNETATLAFRSWTQWQGYSTVTTTHGAAGGPQTVTTSHYYRGMDGDGKNSTDGQSVAWNNRRAGVLTSLGIPGTTSAISGSGYKCLDVDHSGTADGTNVQLWTCNGGGAQVWQLNHDTAGNPIMVNPESGKCLDVYFSGTTDGTNVQLWTCNNGAAQVWQRQPDGSMLNPNSGRCLDITGSGTADGTNIEIWACSGGGPAQVWAPQDGGALATPQAKHCVDVDHSGTANGTRIQAWACNGGAAQVWQAQADGTFKNPNSGKCMDVTNGGTSNGTPVQLYDCTGAGNQVWKAQPDGTLKNVGSGRCLDITGSNVIQGPQLQIWDCNSNITEQWAAKLTDTDGTQGFQREQDSYDGTTLLASTIHTPTVAQTAVRSAPATGGQDLTAHMVTDTEEQSRTWVAATGTWRWTDTQTTYNSYGLPTLVKDLGDTATTNDDTCTTTSYVTPDTSRWLIAFPSEVVTTDCAASPGAGDYLAGTRTLYDGSSTLGQTPTRGLPTQVNALAAADSGGQTWKTASSTGYDPNGRVKDSWDALNHKTSTAYTPASGGPVTAVTVTNPEGWTTNTTLDPGRGNPLTVTDVNGKVTTGQYDPLGRLVKGWSANRATTDTPDVAYTYNLSSSGASVQTLKLGPHGNQIISYQIYDGFLRPRQTQAPATADTGGRIITDTTYDSRGLTAKTSTFWNSASGPAATLVTFNDTDVPTQHRYTYDNSGRQTVDALYSKNSLVSQATTAYDGDRTTVTPPAGGTATRTLTNAQGKTIELDQYMGSTPGGTYQATTYEYDRLGRQAAVHDPAGNTWTTSYDLRGRINQKTDPDTGTSTMTYDDNGQLLTTTDARPITLTNVWDDLGRKKEEWQGPAGTGTKLLDFTYDTLAKGQLTTSNRYANGGTYSSTATGYDDAYRPKGTTVTIPATDGFSPNSWTTTQTYNVDGSVATTTLPAAGGLGEETVTTTYDDTGTPRTLAGLDAYVAGTVYDGFNRAIELDLGADAGVHLAEAFDPATGRLTQTKAATGGTVNQPATWTNLLTVGYRYDPAGNVSGKSSTEADNTISQECFTYDGLRQLTQAWTTTASSCQATPSQAVVGGPDSYWQTYTYDNATGNRKTLVNHMSVGDTTSTYTYPTGHTQPHTLTSVTLSGASTGTSSYGYDPAGNTNSRNPVGKPGQTLTWDPEGHLATLTANGNTTSYIYDAAGNRLIAKDNTGETVYLGPTEIHRSTAGSVTCTRYYSYSDSVIGVRTDTGTLTWQSVDNHGTTELTINATTKAVISRLRTDPFGNPRNTGIWPGTHGFINGLTDPTGLTHLGAREYDPQTGRFISTDPIFEAGDPQQIGGYSYAGNNPTTTSDPTGLCRYADGDLCVGGGNKEIGTIITNGTGHEVNSQPSYTTPTCHYAYCGGGGGGGPKNTATASGKDKNGTTWSVGPSGSSGPTQVDNVLLNSGAVQDVGAYASAVDVVRTAKDYKKYWDNEVALLLIACYQGIVCSDDYIRALASAGGKVIYNDFGVVGGRLAPIAKDEVLALPEGDPVSSKYNDTTAKGSRILNRLTDVGHDEFVENLMGNGWLRSVSKDGKVTILEKGGAKYVVREYAGSYAGWTADFYAPGSQGISLKIRLGG